MYGFFSRLSRAVPRTFRKDDRKRAIIACVLTREPAAPTDLCARPNCRRSRQKHHRAGPGLAPTITRGGAICEGFVEPARGVVLERSGPGRWRSACGRFAVVVVTLGPMVRYQALEGERGVAWDTQLGRLSEKLGRVVAGESPTGAPGEVGRPGRKSAEEVPDRVIPSAAIEEEAAARAAAREAEQRPRTPFDRTDRRPRCAGWGKARGELRAGSTRRYQCPVCRRDIVIRHDRKTMPIHYIENRMVACACGCGGKLLRLDHNKRPRKFISGHNARAEDPMSLWTPVLVAVKKRAPVKPQELAVDLGKSANATTILLFRAHREGLVCRPSYGVYELTKTGLLWVLRAERAKATG